MLKDRKDFCFMLHIDKLAFSMFRLFLKLFIPVVYSLTDVGPHKILTSCDV